MKANSAPGTSAPQVAPGGLVTVAFLKARLDEGYDHLDIFMPLVLSAIASAGNDSFSIVDVQEDIASEHGVVVPHAALGTLLKRAVKRNYLLREAGRYRRNPNRRFDHLGISKEKLRIGADLRQLGEEFQAHALRRKIEFPSPEAALDRLYRFIEVQQVDLLLKAPAQTGGDLSKEEKVAAEFLQHVVEADHSLLAVLKGLLEGLVVYHAAFLPDLAESKRNFRDLKVVFDTVLVRQRLGYEGQAMQMLMRESISLLKASGVRCLVLDKSVHEIERILAMYERRLATEEGRRSLHPVPMARNFLLQQYGPSDVREMAALLRQDIETADLRIISAPPRDPKHNRGEDALTKRLMDPKTKDPLEPRVTHDVDCIATTLTLRKGHRSTSIEDAGALFATTSPLVIRNTRLWWEEDEGESSIPPIVHIRALASLAWLKKPTLSRDFKDHELAALCAATLKPRAETWRRFLTHLEKLRISKRLTSDEEVAILISAMSDRLLLEAEFEQDGDDVDAVTLDEIVERVRNTYREESEARIEAIRRGHEEKLENIRQELESATAAAAQDAERAERYEMLSRDRASTWARLVALVGGWVVAFAVVVGAVLSIVSQRFPEGVLGLLIVVAAVVFVLFEMAANFRHLVELRRWFERTLERWFFRFLMGWSRSRSGMKE